MARETSRPVQASDITVLVRNRLEAAQVREALQTLGIPSSTSPTATAFETLEAQELLWLLQAVLAPERENTLRSALATSMFGLTALDIENLNRMSRRGTRWWKSLANTARFGGSAE